MYAVGIDIGGTKIAGALVDEDGTIVREARVATPASDGEGIVEAVVTLVEELIDGVEAIGVGVAAAGFIDADQALIVYSPNLSWRNEPLKAKLDAKLSIPVIIENDANAAGWAEFRYGAGRGSKHMTMLTIGTGVGGAARVSRTARVAGAVNAHIGGRTLLVVAAAGECRQAEPDRQCGNLEAAAPLRLLFHPEPRWMVAADCAAQSG